MKVISSCIDGRHPYFAQRPDIPLIIIPGDKLISPIMINSLKEHEAPIWIVDSESAGQRRWSSLLSHSDIYVVSDINQLINKSPVDKRYELYAVLDQNNSEQIKKLILSHAPDVVCGVLERSAGDWLQWYQFSAKHCERFSWWVDEASTQVSGRLSSVPVSVVVPVYNVVDWLDECLSSLAHQDLDGLEVIVVDDGSTDGSGEIAKKWQIQYPQRFKTIHQQNSGCATARNTGLSVARGTFTGFVDSDDFVAPNMFSSLFRSAVLRQSDVAQCGWTEFYPDGGKVECPGNENALLCDELSSRPTIWRKIYRTAMLKEKAIVFPAHIRRFDDLPFQFEALFAARKLTTITDCHYFYRQARPGQDIGIKDERLLVHVELFEWLMLRLKPEITRSTAMQAFRLMLNTHYWGWFIIEEPLKKHYLNNIFKQCLGASFPLTHFERFLLARKMGSKMFNFYMRLTLCSLVSRFGLKGKSNG
ncbi:glycosyltransferase [Citrobacter braakii]|uniref:glycosyltransferase n=1 Tax=Citrobacter braakii TaxID=57706 RepID=UPI00115BFC3D|nr:glycosyltransferase [Citrobacter braakii]